MSKIVSVNFVVNDDVSDYEVSARLRSSYSEIHLSDIQPKGAPYMRLDLGTVDLNMSIYTDGEGPKGEV